jgi:hypothetical protein
MMTSQEADLWERVALARNVEQIRESLPSHALVTPAKAGVQFGAPLDSGVRRNDELNLVANHESP